MRDDLGDRIKSFYENITKHFLPRRQYTIVRLDGKAFHSYTRGCERPFDNGLIEDMDNTAIELCRSIQGVKLAFVQSDEISLVITDFDKVNTSLFFGGSVQKIASVSASMAATKFNELRRQRIWNDTGDIQKSLFDAKIANFDSRCFTIPYVGEVYNYLIWRQQDTTRNSIQSVAQSLYSHKELHNKKTNDLQEMIFQKGINWNDYDPKLKRGRLIVKEQYEKNGAIRNKWISVGPDVFTKDKTKLESILDPQVIRKNEV